MNILAKAIVSNSDMIKNYKTCRGKAEGLGKIFIMKNNQPDAVLFSNGEYERIAGIVEYLESVDTTEIENIVKILPKEVSRKKYEIHESKEGKDQNTKLSHEEHEELEMEKDLIIK